MAIITIYENSSSLASSSDILETYLKNGSNTQFNVDGSVTPVLFTYTPPTGKSLELTSIQFGMTSPSAVTVTTDFMHLAGGLTNGLAIIVDGIEIINWKNNRDINLSMEDILAPLIFAKQDRQINGKLFTQAQFGRKILVSNSISFKIQDNLSTLVGAICKIQGKLR